MTRILIFLAGQSCRSSLNSSAAQQRRPTEDMEILVLHPRMQDVGKLTVAQINLPPS
jgi:hypothetical protein